MSWINVEFDHKRERRCQRCGLLYMELMNTGSWKCAYHPKTINYSVGYNHAAGMYECCGGREGSKGCVPCDHDDRVHRFEPEVNLKDLNEDTQNRIFDAELERRPGVDYKDVEETLLILRRLNSHVWQQMCAYGHIKTVPIRFLYITREDTSATQDDDMNMRNDVGEESKRLHAAWLAHISPDPSTLDGIRRYGQQQRGYYKAMNFQTGQRQRFSGLQELVQWVRRHKTHIPSRVVHPFHFHDGETKLVTFCFNPVGEKPDCTHHHLIHKTIVVDMNNAEENIRKMIYMAFYKGTERFGFEWVAHFKSCTFVDFKTNKVIGAPKPILGSTEQDNTADLVQKLKQHCQDDTTPHLKITIDYKPIPRPLLMTEELEAILSHLKPHCAKPTIKTTS